MRDSLLNPQYIIAFIVAIFIFHVFALYFHLYWRIWWLDIPLHILGGFGVSWLSFWYVKKRFSEVPFKKLELFAVLVGAACLVGVLWEIQEFFYTIYIKNTPVFRYWTEANYADTIKDLADDLLGGVSAFIVFYLARLLKTES